MRIIKGERRFGVWAGEPEGRAEDKACCIYEVFPERGIHYQCCRKRGYGPDAEYCKQHAKKLEAK
jgi:hypothetical protein